MKLEIVSYPIFEKGEYEMHHYTDDGRRSEKFGMSEFLAYLQKYVEETGMEIFSISNLGTKQYYHLVKK